MKVVVRTHGGAGLGIGHVRRCLSLAQALSARGAECIFVVNEDGTALDMVRSQGFPAYGVDEDLPGWAETEIAGLAPGIVVADSYRLRTADLESMRREARLVVVDDLADRELPADIVVNCTLGASRSSYRALPETKFLLGPDYALLRPEFADVPRRTISLVVKRILVTLGGGDSLGLAGRMVETALAAVPGATVDVVVGPLDEGGGMGAADNVVLHRSPRSMRDLMVAADLAISAGGQTTYELAATGTPSVVVTVADNQVTQSREWDAAGVFRYAGDARDHDWRGNVGGLVGELAKNAASRAAMSGRGRALVDGRGAMRAAGEILAR